MSERASQLGGKLAVWSESGTGTEVELRLPGDVVYAQAERRSWFSRLLVSRPPAQKRDEGS
jgi:hypothetical protein